MVDYPSACITCSRVIWNQNIFWFTIIFRAIGNKSTNFVFGATSFDTALMVYFLHLRGCHVIPNLIRDVVIIGIIELIILLLRVNSLTLRPPLPLPP